MATSAVVVVAANQNVRLALNLLLSPGLVPAKTRLTASDISFPTTTVVEKENVDGASATATRETNPLIIPPRTTILTGVSAPKPMPITVQLQSWWVLMKADALDSIITNSAIANLAVCFRSS
jgi:hypothetical protein